jgi:hypothetical protein
MFPARLTLLVACVTAAHAISSAVPPALEPADASTVAIQPLLSSRDLVDGVPLDTSVQAGHNVDAIKDVAVMPSGKQINVNDGPYAPTEDCRTPRDPCVRWQFNARARLSPKDRTLLVLLGTCCVCASDRAFVECTSSYT